MAAACAHYPRAHLNFTFRHAFGDDVHAITILVHLDDTRRLKIVIEVQLKGVEDGPGVPFFQDEIRIGLNMPNAQAIGVRFIGILVKRDRRERRIGRGQVFSRDHRQGRGLKEGQGAVGNRYTWVFNDRGIVIGVDRLVGHADHSLLEVTHSAGCAYRQGKSNTRSPDSG